MPNDQPDLYRQAQSAAGSPTSSDNSSETCRSDGPDWSRIDYDVYCSRCGYNLRMLSLPRCTECGIDFEWNNVLDRRQWGSAFLFEYQWRYRPVRSLLKTVWRSYRPGRFWRDDVSLYGDIHILPLNFMIACSVVTFVVLFHALSLLAWSICREAPSIFMSIGTGSPTVWSGFRLIETVFWRLAAIPAYAPAVYFGIIGLVAAYQIFLFFLIWSLRETLANCRIRTAHVVRVIAYNAIPTMMMLAVSTFIVTVILVMVSLNNSWSESSVFIAIAIATVAIPSLVLGLFTAKALRGYLELTRAATVAWVCAFVASFAVFTIAFTWMMQS